MTFKQLNGTAMGTPPAPPPPPPPHPAYATIYSYPNIENTSYSTNVSSTMSLEFCYLILIRKPMSIYGMNSLSP